MRAVYPVTVHNAAWYGQLEVLFPKIGPNREHELLLASCPNALGAAQQFAESVKKLFKTVEIEVVANPCAKDTVSRNRMFRDAVYLIEKKSPMPWIWMEHAYPLERDWLSSVEAEYRSMPRDCHFLGCIANTFFRVQQEPEPLFRPAGRYMRFGVYPHDLASRSKLIGQAGEVRDLPFEVYLQDEIVPQCQPSQTIKTLWASVNYERHTHGFKGEQSPEYESEIRKMEATSVNGHDVSVLHGCRDGSLGMLLMNQDWKGATAKGIKQSIQSANSELEAAKARIRELEKQLTTTVPVSGPEIGPVTTEGDSHTSTAQVATIVRVSKPAKKATKRRGRPRKNAA